MKDIISTLAGSCHVLQITPKMDKNGCFAVSFEQKVASSLGFEKGKSLLILISDGSMVITAKPKQKNLIDAIYELQLRQDETRKDFSYAIEAMSDLLIMRSTG